MLVFWVLLLFIISNFTFAQIVPITQKKYGRIYAGTINNPLFHKLWAPIDRRVINLSMKWKL